MADIGIFSSLDHIDIDQDCVDMRIYLYMRFNCLIYLYFQWLFLNSLLDNHKKLLKISLFKKNIVKLCFLIIKFIHSLVLLYLIN